ncbi:MAG TPA: glycosyl transferase family 36 [Firmicutes bacterium]|nr:glycosyl transferase family 36 [Bacillota bacterium]
MHYFETEYGYFDDERDEYVIKRPDTPRPWVNVICPRPGDYGLVISQTGGGYSWKIHASLNRITRWEQDLVRDDWGKYLYVRDDDTGEIWSVTWKPVGYTPSSYEARHGIGYTQFTSVYRGIQSELVVFVPPGEPLEIWLVRLTNEGAGVEARRLSLFSYFEWLLGAAPDWHREFHKTFIETWYEAESGTLWATKHLWELPNRKGQHWNRDWEYLAFHSTSELPAGYEADKEAFLGRYGSLVAPKAVREGRLSGKVGRWGDAVASLHHRVELRPGETCTLVFVLGAIERGKRPEADGLIHKYKSVAEAERSLARTRDFWRSLLDTMVVETPDPAFNLLTNTWLKYQAISGRLWGRTAYYQTGGAYGFRDQLQDSQVFLPIAPELTKAQIRLHAAHQFRAGNVLHWWHPISEAGLANRISDNRLWLPFVVVNYLKETGDWAFLSETIPYLDDCQDAGSSAPRQEGSSLYQHCRAAIDYSLARLSPRGLPLIGDGDWNDGMNAVGAEGRGESIWLAHFLYGVLREFAEVARRVGDLQTKERYEQEARALKAAVNRYGWDGRWYWRATTDEGALVGSAANEEARIFLNAQTWAIINDTAEGERRAAALGAVKEYLAREYGPLLLWPAYHQPDESIGYLSRYAPGVRENGGMYTHAATWAVWAAVRAHEDEWAWQLYRSFCPVYRGLQPDLYKVEPYVTPGHVAGPDAPTFGEGGWTWYTGSAAWLFRVSTEWLLGIRPEYEGLRIDPCVPAEWDGFTVRRQFRGATYVIRVRNPDHVSRGVKQVWVNGRLVVDRAGEGPGAGSAGRSAGESMAEGENDGVVIAVREVEGTGTSKSGPAGTGGGKEAIHTVEVVLGK